MQAMVFAGAIVFLLASITIAQQPGTAEVEGAPKMELSECDTSGCTKSELPITLDANWRWVHVKDGYQNCYKGSKWVEQFCASPEECAKNCALEQIRGDQYVESYGITGTEGGLTLKFVSKTQYGENYGSRVYLMDGQDKYKMFKLKNKEFSMDADVSSLPCGLNGAVYFVEMDQDGGKGIGNNNAGAKFGTGYCDAQCPHDVKFIAGEANSKNWNHTANPPTGHYGNCCMEMDIWEANSRAAAYTPHPCNTVGAERCEGLKCGDTEKGERYQGVCDKDGCDYNHWRMGDEKFYGKAPDFKVDSSKPLTVVTQFITVDGTDTGDLKEIKRHYMQDGKMIPNSEATILPSGGNSITDNFCTEQKKLFGDVDDYKAKGSMKKMGEALERGVVLVLSLWDDSKVNMLWLDSAYPPDVDPSVPGVARGPCPGGKASTPKFLRENVPDSSVKFTNLAVGPIGTTGGARRRLSEMHL